MYLCCAYRDEANKFREKKTITAFHKQKIKMPIPEI